MYQKCEDFTGIVLQNDNGAGFRGMLPETQQTCQKVADFRGIVSQNDKLAGFPLHLAGNMANVAPGTRDPAGNGRQRAMPQSRGGGGGSTRDPAKPRGSGKADDGQE